MSTSGACGDNREHHLGLGLAQCQHHGRQTLCVNSGQGVAAWPPDRHSCRLGLPSCLEQAVEASVTLSPACTGKQQGQPCLGCCLRWPGIGSEEMSMLTKPTLFALKAAHIVNMSSDAGCEEPQGLDADRTAPLGTPHTWHSQAAAP